MIDQQKVIESTYVTFDDNKYFGGEDSGENEPLKFENADYLEEIDTEEENLNNEEHENENCLYLTRILQVKVK